MCGAELGTEKLEPVSEEIVISARFLNREEPSVKTVDELYQCSLPDRFAIFHGLANLYDATNVARGNRYCGDIEHCIPRLQSFGRLLLDWDDEFLRLVQRHHVRSKDSLRGAFGKAYAAIVTGLHDGAFKFIQRSFDQSVMTLWAGPVYAKTRHGVLRERYVSLAEAARRLAITPATVKERLKALDGQVTKSVSTSKNSFISARMLGALSQQTSQWISQTSIAHRLAISRRAISELVTSGHIKTVDRQAGVYWPEFKERLDQLSGLRTAAASEDSNNQVTIRFALQRLIPRGKWPQVFSALSSGKIPIIELDGVCLGKALIGRRELGLVLESDALRDATVPNVAKQLGMKQEVVYCLIRSRLLPAKTVRFGRRKATVVDSQALARFERDYIPLRDIAAIRRQTSRATLAIAISAGITPTSGPKVDGNRQIFFLRADASALMASMQEGN